MLCQYDHFSQAQSHIYGVYIGRTYYIKGKKVWPRETTYIKIHSSESRGQEAACMRVFGPRNHYSELITQMAVLKFESAVIQPL